MNIKKIIGILPLFIVMAISSRAGTHSTSPALDSAAIVYDDSLKIVQMNVRLAEIQSMNPSDLSVREKKSVRKELITMKREATAMQGEDGGHGGIYLSVGALILIIILLLILF
jgi:hypothetical protein